MAAIAGRKCRAGNLVTHSVSQIDSTPNLCHMVCHEIRSVPVSQTRAYNSPLREEQARATREAILGALYDLMQSSTAPDDIGMEAIARQAGLQRRTLFRHFASKDDLLAAFWPWLNARLRPSAQQPIRWPRWVWRCLRAAMILTLPRAGLNCWRNPLIAVQFADWCAWPKCT
mgnify:CR=1 FL=1